MCGIAGILNIKNDAADSGKIRLMTDVMAHRGPDAVGYFDEGPVTLGHLRLSIIDLSTAANQPFTDNSGRYILVFNGEIYNYNDVKRLIDDYDFRTTSDTEMLIAAYAKWGPDCIRYFRGMFAFAIWDKQEQELFIARDRMGVKPLYYFMNDEVFVFASEVRGILATGLVERKVNKAALRDYFSYQSFSFPHSVIEGIDQLEAGSWMKIKNGRTTQKVYWDVTTAAANFELSDQQKVQERVRELMLQAVRRRMVSDVPVGAFLSGGIDSSAVVGLMAEAAGTSPNTFTISFDEKEYDESPYADIIAKKFKTHHTSVLLKPTVFLDELKDALDSMDIPSGDGINTYIVSKAIAKQGMRVAISGVGGDELFAGYPFFGQYGRLHRNRAWWSLPEVLRKGAAGLLFRGATGKENRMRQLLTAPSPAIEEMYPIFRQVLTPDLIDRLVPDGAPFNTDLHQHLVQKGTAINRLPLISQVSVSEYLGYTQHTLLKDTDQMSMAVSLEVREPFFDQDLVEFILGVPDLYKKPVYPKSLLVESLKPLLPDEIVFRKKQGFVFPWANWLRTDLKAFCDIHIRNMANRPFIQGDLLLKYWQAFLNGDKTIRWVEIWLFVVLEYWLEKNRVEC